jgi:GDP-L-fucose synthase
MPMREFLHVDDLADAALFLMLNYDREEIINVGTGEDLTIEELCGIIREVVGYTGNVEYDPDMPDGTPRKVLDVSRLKALGWSPRIPLRSGIEQTYRWYLQCHFESMA